MANPRTPLVKAKLTGATLKDPKRYKGLKTSKLVRAIGEPYANMSEHECTAWFLFVDELPWLNSSHRAILQVACQLRGPLVSGDGLSMDAIKLYQTILSKLGASPADETKVNHGSDGEEDPTEKYFH